MFVQDTAIVVTFGPVISHSRLIVTAMGADLIAEVMAMVTRRGDLPAPKRAVRWGDVVKEIP